MIQHIPNSIVISEIIPHLDFQDKLALSQSCAFLRTLVSKKQLYKNLWINLEYKIRNCVVEFNNNINKNGQVYKRWVDKDFMHMCIIMDRNDYFVLNDFSSNESFLCPHVNLCMNISYTKDGIAKCFEINIDNNFNLQELKSFSTKLYWITLKNMQLIYSIKNMIYMLNEIRTKLGILYNDQNFSET